MAVIKKIKDEKLQYKFYREPAEISVPSLGKFNKYEYVTGEKILPSGPSQVMEKAKFTFSPLGKAFEKQKQINAIKKHRNQQINAILNLKR